MISSGVYNYVNVLAKATDASWERNSVLSSNIANVDTPDYKRQDVTFSSLLEAELAGSRKSSTLSKKVANVNLSNLTAKVYTDMSELSYRLDGNNVDIDTENVELASNQIKYQGMVTSIDEEFSRMKIAIS